jgi:hypothetical protein
MLPIYQDELTPLESPNAGSLCFDSWPHRPSITMRSPPSGLQRRRRIRANRHRSLSPPPIPTICPPFGLQSGVAFRFHEFSDSTSHSLPILLTIDLGPGLQNLGVSQNSQRRFRYRLLPFHLSRCADPPPVAKSKSEFLKVSLVSGEWWSWTPGPRTRSPCGGPSRAPGGDDGFPLPPGPGRQGEPRTGPAPFGGGGSELVCGGFGAWFRCVRDVLLLRG